MGSRQLFLLPLAGEGAAKRGRMRGLSPKGCAALHGNAPHPTQLRRATFCRKREKDELRFSRAAVVLFATTHLAMPAHADPAQPSGPAVDPSIGTVEVTLEVPKGGDKPYVGEMILLRMRSFIRADIVLDGLQQPPLLNFSWQQLGRDKPISAMVDGFQVAGVERDLAIFPGTAGRLIIEPFVRHVTIVAADNRRVTADFASKPVYVDVQNYAAINPPDAWWLPAKSLTLSDSWSQVPDEIKTGTLTRRTITVEAAGLTADRLPPPPEMQAPGTIAFRGPVDRTTTLTEDGPVARGTYVYDLRPTTSAPALLPPIALAWFDTENRRMRRDAIPETWVAYVGTLVHPSHETPSTLGPLSAGPLAAGLAGFAWAAALAGFLATSRRPPGRRGAAPRPRAGGAASRRPLRGRVRVLPRPCRARPQRSLALAAGRRRALLGAAPRRARRRPLRPRRRPGDGAEADRRRHPPVVVGGRAARRGDAGRSAAARCPGGAAAQCRPVAPAVSVIEVAVVIP